MHHISELISQATSFRCSKKSVAPPWKLLQ